MPGPSSFQGGFCTATEEETLIINELLIIFVSCGPTHHRTNLHLHVLRFKCPWQKISMPVIHPFKL